MLSNGHACALLYVMNHLIGYNVTMEDLKSFRQIDSVTPGHPEANLTDGVEVTTGPLGQGISNAVGLAMAEAHMAAKFNKPGFPVVDNFTFCIVGDGCLQEGVASEACSLAGHLGLGKLIVLYDDNKIQIDGSTDFAFTEDVPKRFESYGWHVLSVEDGDGSIDELKAAIEAAKAVTDKPSMIRIRTTIGYGSSKEGTEKVHGAPLGADDIKQVKEKFGFDPEVHFHVPDEVRQFYQSVRTKNLAKQGEWSQMFAKYAKEHPDLAAEFQRRLSGDLPSGWEKSLPRYDPESPAQATRKLSQAVLNSIADKLPELIGGSADLTPSNLTKWKSATEFQKPGQIGDYSGRYLRFGVREHGMAAICNGLAAYGGIIPFGATFLNFIGYAQGGFRLSCLSHFRVLYIMTHDSIGLGEDGPTHQPIEILSMLRATPNCLTLRPADGNEVSGAYLIALQNKNRPSVLCFTRQGVPSLKGSSIENTMKGGYVLEDIGSSSDIALILVGTGSEVGLCVESAKKLVSDGSIGGKGVRVVSMPCTELFDEQPLEYRLSVFPKGVPVMSVEAMSTRGWERYAHASVGVDVFGASAPYKDVYAKFGLTAPQIAEKAKKVVDFYSSGENVAQSLMAKPF